MIAAAAGFYAADHFAITTNVNNLLSSGLPSREREAQYDNAFSSRAIAAVVAAPTPELVEQAAERLTARLVGRHGPIRDPWQADGGAFFERNGLLFLRPDQLGQSVRGSPAPGRSSSNLPAIRACAASKTRSPLEQPRSGRAKRNSTTCAGR